MERFEKVGLIARENEKIKLECGRFKTISRKITLSRFLFPNYVNDAYTDIEILSPKVTLNETIMQNEIIIKQQEEILRLEK
ncbi:MAG: hypothetical protein FWE36_01640 [Erysipelotrichales bacterium]|nr:hypothetical protein [Erysipelotrichales bacterium]